jgi:hypothetical protein
VKERHIGYVILKVSRVLMGNIAFNFKLLPVKLCSDHFKNYRAMSKYLK